MKLHAALCGTCALLSLASLAGAYLLVGQWWIWLAIAGLAVLWLSTGGQPAFWPASSLLALYILLAIVGLLMNASTLVIGAGSVFALAAWDLVDFRESLVGDPQPEARAAFEKSRLESLAIAAGASLLLVAAGSWLHLALPFGMLVVLVLLAGGCIWYAVRQLGEGRNEV